MDKKILPFVRWNGGIFQRSNKFYELEKINILTYTKLNNIWREIMSNYG